MLQVLAPPKIQMVLVAVNVSQQPVQRCSRRVLCGKLSPCPALPCLVLLFPGAKPASDSLSCFICRNNLVTGIFVCHGSHSVFL